MLYNRIDQGKQAQPQCIDFVYPIILTYNNKMVHSFIKMTPFEASKPSNAIDVKNITRKYPELEIGSNVKQFRQESIRTQINS